MTWHDIDQQLTAIVPTRSKTTGTRVSNQLRRYCRGADVQMAEAMAHELDNGANMIGFQVPMPSTACLCIFSMMPWLYVIRTCSTGCLMQQKPPGGLTLQLSQGCCLLDAKRRQ